MPREIEQGLGAGGDACVTDPFVGRDLELSALAASLASVAAGAGRMDIVTGAPGIGKTRLVQAFAALAEAEGARVLRAGCWEGEGAPPFWPWTLVLRDILGEPATGDAVAAAPELRALLQRALAVQSVEGLAEVGDSRDAEQARFDLFDRFATLLRELSHERPLVVAIDDAQCADSGSLLLLQFLAGRLADARIGVLVTARDPLPEAISGTCRHPWTRHIALAGLSRTDACRLLEARAGQPPRPEVVDRLMALTEGNPFYLRELGHVLMNSAGPVEVLSLPPSLSGVTMHQFDALSPACRALLQVASVIGREFEATLAASICGLSTSDALNLLQEALDRHVVTLLPPTRFRFAHALVREGVYDRLHVSERLHVHVTLARMLECPTTSPADTSAATLAHHTFLGLPHTDRIKASSYAILAGHEAHAQCAYEEAVRLLRRARDLAAVNTDAATCDLLLSLGASESAAGEWAAARQTFEQAARLARRSLDARRFSRAALGFKGLMWATIPVDQNAVAYLEEAKDRLGDVDPELTVELLSALSRALYFLDKPDLPGHYRAAAVTLAGRVGTERAHATALEAHTVGLLTPAGMPHVYKSATELLRLGGRLADLGASFHARIFRQSSLLACGDVSEADNELSHAAAIADSTRHPRFQWQVALLRSARATFRGDLSRGEALAHHAWNLGQRVHDSSPTQYALLQAFQRGLLLHHHRPLLTTVTAAIESFPTVLALRIGRALLLARLGQYDEATDALFLVLDTHFTTIPENNLTLWLLTALAETVYLCGLGEPAARLFDRLSPFSGHYVTAAWGTLLDGSVAHYLGLLAITLGKPVLAEKHFAAALQANRRVGSAPLIARTQLVYARFLDASRTPSSVSPLQLVHSASSTFRQLNLSELEKQASELVSILSHDSAYIATDDSPHRRPVGSRPSLRLEGRIWALSYEGLCIRLADSRGLRFIRELVRARGEPVHAIRLVAAGSTVTEVRPDSAFPFSDIAALSAYRKRLREIDEALEDAAHCEDSQGVHALERERDFILRELSRSLGLRGRSRRTSVTERARINVKNRITATLALIKPVHPAAWRHLSVSIRTGTECSYCPPEPLDWDT